MNKSSFWNKLQQQIMSQWKCGDIVHFDSQLIKEGNYEGCPLCYDEERAENGTLECGVLETFNKEDLCQKHQIDMPSLQ